MNKHLITAGFIAFSISVSAQSPAALTAKDYQHAESFLSYKTDSLVKRNNIRPNWFSGDKLWYMVSTDNGNEFVIVDPVRKTRSAAFDQAKLATALSKAAGKQYEAKKLPFQVILPSPDGKSISFVADSNKWKYDLNTNE